MNRNELRDLVLPFTMSEGMEARLDSNGNCTIVDPRTGASAVVGSQGVLAAIHQVKASQIAGPHNQPKGP